MATASSFQRFRGKYRCAGFEVDAGQDNPFARRTSQGIDRAAGWRAGAEINGVGNAVLVVIGDCRGCCGRGLGRRLGLRRRLRFGLLQLFLQVGDSGLAGVERLLQRLFSRLQGFGRCGRLGRGFSVRLEAVSN